MNANVCCGFCSLTIQPGEKLGKIVDTSGNCHHHHHYRCLIRPLAEADSRSCPICSTEYNLVIPIFHQQQQQQEQNIVSVIVSDPTTTEENPSSSSMTIYLNSIPTPPQSPDSVPPLQNNQQQEPVAASPSQPEIIPSHPPPQQNQQQQQPVRRRKQRTARCIFRRETSNPNPHRRGINSNTHPLSLTCQYCRRVYNTRMEKSRCEERHLGPYKCSDCPREFELHSYMRRHFSRNHGGEWSRNEGEN